MSLSSNPGQTTVKNVIIRILKFHDIGGQNKIYTGKMTQINPEDGQETTMDVILKTA